jgi:hypothetical protein
MYSARYGQWGNPAPHSRCRPLGADIPIVLDAQQVWLRSEIPRECPRYRNEQTSIFEALA